MPLYVDRHEVEGVTAKEVAEMHVRDLDYGPKVGVRWLTYWWDEQMGHGFCLVDAPSAEAVTEAHREAHGLIPARIVEADERVVRHFLGRIQDPPSGGPITETAFRTILFTDLEGSTSMTQRLGDAQAMEVLRMHDLIVRGALSEWGGTEVKHTGDGIMASFVSPVDGVSAAIAMQRKFASFDGAQAGGLRVRMGMSAGEPVTEQGDFFGAAVQLARRCCDYGEPGQIVVSNVVRDLCIGKGFVFESRGDVDLKGFDEPVRLYVVLWDAGSK